MFAGATASAQSQTNKLRIGIFDSRAIAIAYANSSGFEDSLKHVRAEHEKARAEKNEKQMKEIEARMKREQRRMHERGFSTGSVAGILATVQDALPAVAKKAHVMLIVSKWEVNYSAPSVELVDVTDDLVALFHPNEKVLNQVKSCRQQKPLPIEAISDDMD
jgi:hypothetical protein